MGVEKIIVLEGGRYEMVVNSRFNDLEGGVGLKRVWVFVPEVGKKRGMKFWRIDLSQKLPPSQVHTNVGIIVAIKERIISVFQWCSDPSSMAVNQ